MANTLTMQELHLAVLDARRAMGGEDSNPDCSISSSSSDDRAVDSMDDDDIFRPRHDPGPR